MRAGGNNGRDVDGERREGTEGRREGSGRNVTANTSIGTPATLCGRSINAPSTKSF